MASSLGEEQAGLTVYIYLCTQATRSRVFVILSRHISAEMIDFINDSLREDKLFPSVPSCIIDGRRIYSTRISSAGLNFYQVLIAFQMHENLFWK